MRKNQAAQSIAMAFGLVGGLGFLGYTMLGDMLVGDPARSEQVASEPAPQRQAKGVVTRIAAAPIPQTLSVSPAVELRQEPTVASAGANAVPALAVGAAVAAAALPNQTAPAPAAVPMHTAPVQAPSATMPAAIPSVQAATPAPASLAKNASVYAAQRALPVQQVVMAPPPVPIQPIAAPVFPSALEAPAEATTVKRGKKRRQTHEARIAATRVAPVAPKAFPMRAYEPAMSAPRAAPVAVAAPVAPAAVAPAPVERRAAVAAPPSSEFTSKDDMAVTISGQKAWVQVSPTRTMEAKKGDVLPNLGKILEIRGNQVVAEKGTLTTN